MVTSLIITKNESRFDNYMSVLEFFCHNPSVTNNRDQIKELIPMEIINESNILKNVLL